MAADGIHVHLRKVLGHDSLRKDRLLLAFSRFFFPSWTLQLSPTRTFCLPVCIGGRRGEGTTTDTLSENRRRNVNTSIHTGTGHRGTKICNHWGQQQQIEWNKRNEHNSAHSPVRPSLCASLLERCISPLVFFFLIPLCISAFFRIFPATVSFSFFPHFFFFPTSFFPPTFLFPPPLPPGAYSTPSLTTFYCPRRSKVVNISQQKNAAKRKS